MSESVVKIKVFGVGGGGNNAVNRMVALRTAEQKLKEEKIASGEWEKSEDDEELNEDVTYVAINTDNPVLKKSKADETILIGDTTTEGRGAGANPEIGKMAAEESIEKIKKALEGVDMLYITAGMGGGTGTGASPVIARVAKEMGILTVAVVTRPFAFEKGQRAAVAEDGIARLRPQVDALIVVSNEKLKMIERNITMKNAFAVADNVLVGSVKSICNVIYKTAVVNTDFADVETILRDAGDAHIGIGSATGENKWEIAAKQAMESPLLDTSIAGATGIIINITADEDIPLDEVDKLSNMITNQVPDAKVIWGIDLDPTVKDYVQVVVIATKITKDGLKKIDVSEENPVDEEQNVDDEETVKEADETPEEAPKVEEHPQKTESEDNWMTDEEFDWIRTVANHSDKKNQK